MRFHGAKPFALSNDFAFSFTLTKLLIMKVSIILFLLLFTALRPMAQNTEEAGWTYTIFPSGIIHLNYSGEDMDRNEKISDAVVLKALHPTKKIPGLESWHQIKGKKDSIWIDGHQISVCLKGAAIQVLAGWDSGKTRGMQIALPTNSPWYGGGERATPMNRLGQRFMLYNNPAYGYAEGADALNFSVPMLIGTTGYGLLFDNPSKGYLDVGKTNAQVLEAGFESGRLDLYLIPGKTPAEILTQYTLLTGRQPLPPRWAFGNFISRFGYLNQQQAEDVVGLMQKEKFHADAVIIDLFWFGDSIKGTMGNLNWNQPKWPNPEKMIAGFKKQGLETILITEPFVLKSTPNFKTSQPHLATQANGQPFILEDFYFGKGGLIDLFKPQARQWFWKFYAQQIKKGVSGWWGDLGEPEKHPADLYHNLGSMGVKRLMSANEVHNLYGHQWSKMLHTQYAQNYPRQRLFHLNRAGFAGSQRYSIFPWTGDVSRSWSGLRAQLPNLQSMSLSGIPYIHSDAGGFAGGEKDSELYTRWLQFAAYTPVFRPHGTALGNLEAGVADISSEPAFQPEPYKSIVRKVIRNRYQLLPYHYSMAYEQSSLGKPLIRPMFFDNVADSNLLKANDQYMWGSAFLIAPVLQASAINRSLYLPVGEWYAFATNERITGGRWIEPAVTLNEIPVYVKAGSFVPFWMDSLAKNTKAYTPLSKLHIRYYPSSINSEYLFFDDDGKNPASIASKQFQLIKLTANTKDALTTIQIKAQQWPKGAQRKIFIEIPALETTQKIMLNGKRIAAAKTNNGWLSIPVLFNGKNNNISFTSNL